MRTQNMQRVMMVLGVLLAGVGAVQAATYELNPGNSRIGFSGTHAGKAFTGVFEQWQGVLKFDPTSAETLAKSTLTVSIRTASAKTGNAMYDGTLPTADWFNSGQHPQAGFQSQSITATGISNTYLVTGELNLRNVRQSVSFTVVLAGPAAANAPLKANAALTLNRLAYGIGQQSDPQAAWVSQEIGLQIGVEAAAKP
jgi:polyisoprenoid-binding protein YceI